MMPNGRSLLMKAAWSVVAVTGTYSWGYISMQTCGQEQHYSLHACTWLRDLYYLRTVLTRARVLTCSLWFCHFSRNLLEERNERSNLSCIVVTLSKRKKQKKERFHELKLPIVVCAAQVARHRQKWSDKFPFDVACNATEHSFIDTGGHWTFMHLDISILQMRVPQ